MNVASFYKMYADAHVEPAAASDNVLDRWIVSRMNQLVAMVTENMDRYVFLEPTRAIRDFVADLSQWYLRRSRDRFKEGGADARAALATTKYVLIRLAEVMAPFTPFFAEELYRDIAGRIESVHLRDWPEGGPVDAKLIKDMETVRAVASKGLEARTSAKINVRQPLAVFETTSAELSSDLADVLKDELNVKAIRFGASADRLDTAITSELKEEGDLRELLRTIQDMRKEKGLTVKDMAVLVATDAEKSLLTKYADEVKKVTRLSSIEYGSALGLK
jgi:isoleucyl-tRNA synthetase